MRMYILYKQSSEEVAIYVQYPSLRPGRRTFYLFTVACNKGLKSVSGARLPDEITRGGGDGRIDMIKRTEIRFPLFRERRMLRDDDFYARLFLRPFHLNVPSTPTQLIIHLYCNVVCRGRECVQFVEGSFSARDNRPVIKKGK